MEQFENLIGRQRVVSKYLVVFGLLAFGVFENQELEEVIVEKLVDEAKMYSLKWLKVKSIRIAYYYLCLV